MALYLVQHGKCFPKEVDPARSLSDDGISEVERIAMVARGYGVHVAGIKHSGKQRAQQTAEIFAAALQPILGVHARDGLAPLDDVKVVAGEVDNQNNIMLVGHLPFMSRLTSLLVIGDVEQPVFRFQNGGIVCLDEEPGTRQWVIKWTLMPNID